MTAPPTGRSATRTSCVRWSPTTWPSCSPSTFRRRRRHAPSRLIGRDRDVARVLDLLADLGTRMITIVGTGGIGKSRLALAVAEGAKDRFAGGMAYVELAAVTETSLVLPTIAKALGVQERTGVGIGIQLRDRLADAWMLIVLDNMEQLIDAAGDVSDLLASADTFQLLVTSRRILNI